MKHKKIVNEILVTGSDNVSTNYYSRITLKVVTVSKSHVNKNVIRITEATKNNVNAQFGNGNAIMYD